MTHAGSLRPEDDDFDMEEELQKLHPVPRQTLPPELETGSRRALVADPNVMVIFEDSDSEQGEEESDSDGPVLYREDDEEDVPMSMTP